MKDIYSNLFPELTEQLEVHIQNNARKVFVNRNLKMKKIKMIGFDMDYTLAPYMKKETEDLEYQLVKERLVAEYSFPKEILDFQYIPDFIILGLSLDLKTGNLIKIDRYNFVAKGFHGLKQLSEDEILTIYRSKNTPLDLYNDFVRIDTLFSLPETCLFAQIIDKYPENSFYTTFKELYEKIRNSTDMIHRDGTLKEIIKKNISKYIVKDIDLPLTLHNFINSGKKLFLLTNSYYDYTNAVMSYLLTDALPEYNSWQDYFSLIIVGSKKPSFFSNQPPAIKLNEQGEHIDSIDFETKIFEGGNIEFLEEFTGLKGERILYIGDHIYGDILKVKKTSMWRTCLIIEDLEKEIQINEKNRDVYDSMKMYDLKMNLLDSELNYQKMISESLTKTMNSTTRIISSLEKKVFIDLIDKSEEKIKKITSLLKEVLREYHILKNTFEKQYNRYWGMIFKENREKTKFADQMEDFACLYTSRVTNFLFYSPFQYFRSPMDVMAHEL
ncbi:HAD-IG family 5'-nucleotidase [bacterium]|nr:HAD-IG family 5'-nucleotidase [bacterium]